MVNFLFRWKAEQDKIKKRTKIDLGIQKSL